MTNQEKNIRLAQLLGLNTYNIYAGIRVVVPDSEDYYFNPCEDYNQLMPLCFEHSEQLECGISKNGHSYIAVLTDINGRWRLAVGKSKQIALVACLIAVLEGKEKAND